MKPLLVVIVVVSIILISLNVEWTNEMEVIIEKEPSTVEEPVQEVDEIERARQELDRINKELDAKEQELLEQRDAIDAELERVRETRLSFQ